ncbi:site-specific integrase [Chloroflexales bacterium ZM16-3]|nr:site-specific integrase [Chloroflexales bacterium ZM16-3]
MLEDMQLKGLAPGTQRAYLRYVQQLAEFVGKSPDQATDEDFRQFFLALHKVRGLSRSSATVAIAAFKFLFEVTLRRPWPRLDLYRPRQIQTVPVVLSVDEVWHMLSFVHQPSYYACLATIYTCGLRISEGANLQVSWIDSARMQLQIRGGKGLKDRYIPLPPRTLTLLRQQWVTHRNPVWLFPAGARAKQDGAPHRNRAHGGTVSKRHSQLPWQLPERLGRTRSVFVEYSAEDRLILHYLPLVRKR